jgi:hypothetical protein
VHIRDTDFGLVRRFRETKPIWLSDGQAPVGETKPIRQSPDWLIRSFYDNEANWGLMPGSLFQRFSIVKRTFATTTMIAILRAHSVDGGLRPILNSTFIMRSGEFAYGVLPTH